MHCRQSLLRLPPLNYNPQPIFESFSSFYINHASNTKTVFEACTSPAKFWHMEHSQSLSFLSSSMASRTPYSGAIPWVAWGAFPAQLLNLPIFVCFLHHLYLALTLKGNCSSPPRSQSLWAFENIDVRWLSPRFVNLQMMPDFPRNAKVGFRWPKSTSYRCGRYSWHDETTWVSMRPPALLLF